MSKRTAANVAGAAKAKKARPAKAASVHKLAAPMPEGTVLSDLAKKQWKLGKPIGSGGFGLIYLTDLNSNSPVGADAEYCMKLEPHDNGPLFCELHFYQRAAQPDAIKAWMVANSLKSLGMPRFVAAGSHDRDGKKYRFMVMQRFGTDLQKLFESSSKRFPSHTVFLLGLRLLNVLQYIHEKGYVHADIKAANLLTGHTDPNEVYLIDYGLAFRYEVDGKHKEYKEDPRKAHDGTIEFTSRDAHNGVCPSRRGDLEILGYCMLQWLCGKLPWEDNLVNKDYVRAEKIRYMKDVSSLLNKCFPDKKDPALGELQAYLQYVVGLAYDVTPDYSKCRQLFCSALKRLGHKENERLDFTAPSTSSNSTATPKKTAVKKRQAIDGPATGRHHPNDESTPKAHGRTGKGLATPKSVKGHSDEREVDENKDIQYSTSPPKKHSPASPKKQPVKRKWPQAKKPSAPVDALSGKGDAANISIAAYPSSPLKKHSVSPLKKQRLASPAKMTPVKPIEPLTKKNTSAEGRLKPIGRNPLEIAKKKNAINGLLQSPSKAGKSKASPKSRKPVGRKRNVPKATIETQTTPGLKERQ